MNNNSKKGKKPTVESELIDLYLKIKVRKNEDIENLNDKALLEEKNKLKGTDPIVLINYIKSSVDILIKLKADELFEEHFRNRQIQNGSGASTDLHDDTKAPGEPINEYEALLIKAEADIRFHLKTEHQLKLHSDNLQSKLDEMERTIAETKQKYQTLEKDLNHNKLKEFTEIKEIEIQKLKLELSQMKSLLKSNEEQNIKIAEYEKKINNLKEQEMEYKEKNRKLSEQIKVYEDIKKTNQHYKISLDEEFVPVSFVSGSASALGATLDSCRMQDKEYLNSKINLYRKTMEKKQHEINGFKLLIDDLKRKLHYLNQINNSNSNQSQHEIELDHDHSIERLDRHRSKDKMNVSNLSGLGGAHITQIESNKVYSTNMGTISNPNNNSFGVTPQLLNPFSKSSDKNKSLEKLSSSLMDKYNIPKNKRTNSELPSAQNNISMQQQQQQLPQPELGKKFNNAYKSNFNSNNSFGNGNITLRERDNSNGHIPNHNETVKDTFNAKKLQVPPQGKSVKYLIDKKNSNLKLVPVPNPHATLNHTGLLNYKGPQNLNLSNNHNTSNQNLKENQAGQMGQMNNTGLNHFKTNDLNLRQYIINKITNKKSSKNLKDASLTSRDYTHNRSSSMVHFDI